MIEAFQYEFMRNAVYASFLVSLLCGVIGSIVVIKRIVSLSGGIAHAAFGGIGLGYFLGFNPSIGAMIFSIISALTMGILIQYTKEREDTVIGIIWALGMALGIVFITKTPGYAPDLMSYLFGSILTVPWSDVQLMALLTLVVLGTIFFFYKELLSVLFDEEFAVISGIPVKLFYYTLLCLIALSIVVLIRVVGIILVISLLTVPPAIALLFSANIKRVMGLAVLIGLFCMFAGLWFSFITNLPSGATIILVSGVLYLLALLVKRLKGILQR